MQIGYFVPLLLNTCVAYTVYVWSTFGDFARKDIKHTTVHGERRDRRI